LANLQVPNMAEQDSDDMHSPFPEYKKNADNDEYESFSTLQRDSDLHEPKHSLYRDLSSAHEVR
jgi:hypothetical protein